MAFDFFQGMPFFELERDELPECSVLERGMHKDQPGSEFAVLPGSKSQVTRRHL